MPCTPIEIRIWRRIDQRGDDDCWLWTGSKMQSRNGSRYGRIGEGGKYGRALYVHRVMHEIAIGPIPTGYEVDHLCRNTLCCNPGHLEAVPPFLNNARSSSPTSQNMRKDMCPQGHAYDAANTGYRSGKDWRYCRACAREAQRARRLGMTYPEWLASRGQ